MALHLVISHESFHSCLSHSLLSSQLYKLGNIYSSHRDWFCSNQVKETVYIIDNCNLTFGFL